MHPSEVGEQYAQNAKRQDDNEHAQQRELPQALGVSEIVQPKASEHQHDGCNAASLAVAETEV